MCYIIQVMIVTVNVALGLVDNYSRCCIIMAETAVLIRLILIIYSKSHTRTHRLAKYVRLYLNSKATP